MSAYRKILYQVDQGIARLSLNRPEKRNALDDELIAEVKDALARSAADVQVRVVLLTGEGRDFCSGADLTALQRSETATVMETRADVQATADLFLQMRRLPHPIVAAVRGRALAGGCGLATAADIILAEHSAQFGYPEVNIGFIPAMVMAILRRSISEKAAFELIVSGEALPAARALEIGLIHHVFPDERFDDEVEAYVARLAAKPPSAVTLSKNLLYHMDALTFEAALQAGVDANVIARMTEECKAGVARFLKKS